MIDGEQQVFEAIRHGGDSFREVLKASSEGVNKVVERVDIGIGVACDGQHVCIALLRRTQQAGDDIVLSMRRCVEDPTFILTSFR